MSEKKTPKLLLTPEQRKILAEIRRHAEAEKPELMAEGRRVFAADKFVSARLEAAMSILKAVRKAQGLTLDQIAEATGMTKPYLSKIENDNGANVTVNTLYRIADALNHDLQISVTPRSASRIDTGPASANVPSKKPQKIKAIATPKPGK